MDARRCVYVVDDEPDLLDVLSEHLSDAGFRVCPFGHAATALEALRGGTVPDLFILDLFLPDLTDAELAAMLRREPRTAQVPVLFVSAAPHLVPSGLEVVSKPFDPDRLLDRARTLCRPRRA